MNHMACERIKKKKETYWTLNQNKHLSQIFTIQLNKLIEQND